MANQCAQSNARFASNQSHRHCHKKEIYHNRPLCIFHRRHWPGYTKAMKANDTFRSLLLRVDKLHHNGDIIMHLNSLQWPARAWHLSNQSHCRLVCNPEWTVKASCTTSPHLLQLCMSETSRCRHATLFSLHHCSKPLQSVSMCGLM